MPNHVALAEVLVNQTPIEGTQVKREDESQVTKITMRYELPWRQLHFSEHDNTITFIAPPEKGMAVLRTFEVVLERPLADNNEANFFDV